MKKSPSFLFLVQFYLFSFLFTFFLILPKPLFADANQCLFLFQNENSKQNFNYLSGSQITDSQAQKALAHPELKPLMSAHEVVFEFIESMNTNDWMQLTGKLANIKNWTSFDKNNPFNDFESRLSKTKRIFSRSLQIISRDSNRNFAEFPIEFWREHLEPFERDFELVFNVYFELRDFYSSRHFSQETLLILAFQLKDLHRPHIRTSFPLLRTTQSQISNRITNFIQSLRLTDFTPPIAYKIAQENEVLFKYFIRAIERDIPHKARRTRMGIHSRSHITEVRKYFNKLYGENSKLAIDRYTQSQNLKAGTHDLNLNILIGMAVELISQNKLALTKIRTLKSSAQSIEVFLNKSFSSPTERVIAFFYSILSHILFNEQIPINVDSAKSSMSKNRQAINSQLRVQIVSKSILATMSRSEVTEIIPQNKQSTDNSIPAKKTRKRKSIKVDNIEHSDHLSKVNPALKEKTRFTDEEKVEIPSDGRALSLPTINSNKRIEILNGLDNPKDAYYLSNGQLKPLFVYRLPNDIKRDGANYLHSVLVSDFALLSTLQNNQLIKTWDRDHLVHSRDNFNQFMKDVLGQTQIVVLRDPIKNTQRLILPQHFAFRRRLTVLDAETKLFIAQEALHILENLPHQVSDFNHNQVSEAYLALRVLNNLIHSGGTEVSKSQIKNLDTELLEALREPFSITRLYELADSINEGTVIYPNITSWRHFKEVELIHALLDMLEAHFEPAQKNRFFLSKRLDYLLGTLPLDSQKRPDYSFAHWNLDLFISETHLNKLFETHPFIQNLNISAKTNTQIQNFKKAFKESDQDFFMFLEANPETIRDIIPEHYHMIVPTRFNSKNPTRSGFTSVLVYKKDLPINVRVNYHQKSDGQDFKHGMFSFEVFPMAGNLAPKDQPLMILFSNHMKSLGVKNEEDKRDLKNAKDSAKAENDSDINEAHQIWNQANVDNPSSLILVFADVNKSLYKNKTRKSIYGQHFHDMRAFYKKDNRDEEYTHMSFSRGGSPLTNFIDTIAGNQLAHQNKSPYISEDVFKSGLVEYTTKSQKSEKIVAPNIEDRNTIYVSDHVPIFARIKNWLLKD